MELIYLWIKEYKNIDEIGISLEINYIKAEDKKINLKLYNFKYICMRLSEIKILHINPHRLSIFYYFKWENI